MFYSLFSNPSDAQARDMTNTGPVQSFQGNHSYYNSLNAPFALLFETFHPENEDVSFIYTVLSPDETLYSHCSRSEILPIVKNLPLHQHDYYELLFVLEGELYQVIESARHVYPAGSCCLLNRNVRHAEEFSGSFRVAYLEMSPDFLTDLISEDTSCYFREEHYQNLLPVEQFFAKNGTGNAEKEYVDFIPLKDSSWVEKNIHELFDALCRITLNPEAGASLMVKYLFVRLFYLLGQTEYYRNTPIQIGTETEARLFNEISRCMIESNGRATRSQLEKQLNYSGDYLNKIVKKYTGLNIFHYGMTYCMKESSRLLRESSLSISEIALQMGFSNRAHFYKIFRETYQMTPKEYRRRSVATGSSQIMQLPFS